MVIHEEDYGAFAVRPFVKWAGGKRSLLPRLLAHVPDEFGTYYEPFVGGGALFFELRGSGRIETRRLRTVAVLNDVNARLMRAYRAVQGLVGVDTVLAVIAKLSRMRNTKEFFLRARAKVPESMVDDADAAAWLIYLNRTCFNGLYRVNRRGEFNVPFGDYADPKICDADNLRACAYALGGAEAGDRYVKLRSEDFERSVRGAKKGDFVYFDPPYLPRTGVEFTGYDASSFGLEEHRRLRDLARDLKRRGVRVLVSNSGADEVRRLYARGFKTEEVRGARNIGATADRRVPAPDLLIW